MSKSFSVQSGEFFDPKSDEPVMLSLFKQYESIIIESLVTSFGLDFLVKDRHGGDVDTVLNVRKIDKDEQMTYKNNKHKEAYANQEPYHSHTYHSDKRYISKNREIRQKKDAGTLFDAYTGEKIARNEKSDLDHVISAKEVNDDRGRVLAGLKGTDLANSPENLEATNPRTNRTKKADTMDTFTEKYGDEYSDSQKENMLQKDKKAREAYEKKIAKAYYTSSNFMTDTALAAGKVGAKMGLRQVLGFIFTEIWFAVKEEFKSTDERFDLSNMFKKISNGIKRGFENARVKYKDLLETFLDGALAGMLSSLMTTLCNIFFTTAKNAVKIIRQTYMSIIKAAKVLFVNPDHLPFGELMSAVSKHLAIGASIVVGSLVSEAVGTTPICAVPVVGEIVQTFCGVLVTGIMSCTLLYFFDHNEVVKQLIAKLNKLHTTSDEVNYFIQQAAYFDQYAAELMKIDLATFREETEVYDAFAIQIETVQDENELNVLLKNITNQLGIKLPWTGEFNHFMSDRDSVLVFE
ncbi:hypothetical protein [Saccharibacillus sacchari]|uniref:hypothetical protein n=1 Tax=Saccharibacillus sacchari TaxID=456493 RepID=UPI0004AFFAEB|nr:hypothetical protein [Saccharibacillus sacchari]